MSTVQGKTADSRRLLTAPGDLRCEMMVYLAAIDYAQETTG
jgi:hypothetical protein